MGRGQEGASGEFYLEGRLTLRNIGGRGRYTGGKSGDNWGRGLGGHWCSHWSCGGGVQVRVWRGNATDGSRDAGLEISRLTEILTYFSEGKLSRSIGLILILFEPISIVFQVISNNFNRFNLRQASCHILSSTQRTQQAWPAYREFRTPCQAPPRCLFLARASSPRNPTEQSSHHVRQKKRIRRGRRSRYST